MSGILCEENSRSAWLLGEEGLQRLAAARVLVFGLGGVGGHAAEALARAGVGALTLVDGDTVAPSNLNRQLVALHSTLGQPKVEVMRRRIADIAPACQVEARQLFYLPENADSLPFAGYDCIVDAVDTVSAKLCIIQRAEAAGVPVISCMGTGNRLHADCLRLGDLAETQGCHLARVMRRELRRRGIEHVPVLYSTECARAPLPADVPTMDISGTAVTAAVQITDAPAEPGADAQMADTPGTAISDAGATSGADTQTAVPPPVRKAPPPGSVSFVPSVAGLLIAGEVVRRIAGV